MLAPTRDVPWNFNLGRPVRLQLPAPNKEKHMGKWIVGHGFESMGKYTCSKCGHSFFACPQKGESLNIFKFCPECGERMDEEPVDETDTPAQNNLTSGSWQWNPVLVGDGRAAAGEDLKSSEEKSFYDVQPRSEQYRMVGLYPEKKTLNRGIWSGVGRKE